MSPARLVPTACALALAALSSVARAEEDDAGARRARVPMVIPDFSKEPPPAEPSWVPRADHRWIWESLTVGRVNPLGAAMRLRTGYRAQLSHAPGELFEESFAAVRLVSEITPAFATVGGRVEIQPVAVLNLAAQYELVGAFGIFNFLQSFPSPTAAHDDETLRDLRGDNDAARGELATLGAVLQAKIDALAVRNEVQVFWQRMDLEAGDTVFYNARLDLLQASGGWALGNDTDLIYLTRFGLKFGVRYSYADAFYASAIDPTGIANAEAPLHRIGPSVLYTFFEKPPGARYNAPTLALLTQWWLKHPSRTGQVSSAALPYILLAFAQKGDFLP
jgi:hypothetical protein